MEEKYYNPDRYKNRCKINHIILFKKVIASG
jgi:hypothetical protein